ncbi:hypothetical protein OIU77_027312 [Salix suchowensis]|uniref:Cytochrome P450 n=1 Tax=Salix suchowensis TaxID=1278906 RepID=A0ABQ9BRZ1_9ROSI|nr:hypothetical protein OIU77_027312 [Salix suchowensis]
MGGRSIYLSLLIACTNGVLVVLRQLRARYGPIVTLHLGSEPSIFITTHEAAHKALVQGGSIFASRPPALETTRIMLSNETTVTTAPYGPLWLQLRQNFMSAFHPSRLHYVFRWPEMGTEHT